MKKLIIVILSLSFLLCACSRPQAHSVLIAAGGKHTCALGGDGGVRCWGSNEKGQLGDGALTDSPVPVAVRGLGNDTIALAAGGRHTCALSAAGRIRCWGDNEKGQLGNGTSTDSPTPVNVSRVDGGMVAIAAGDEFTCALSAGGGVRCWGDNARGQLGNGASSDSPLPVNVSGLESGAIAIAAGGEHACALTENGSVKCWGKNAFGQLGNKTKKDSPTPVDVSDLAGGVVAITAGGGQTCALTGAGGVKCWGWDGNETRNHYVLKPEEVGGLENGVTAIAAGAEHTCALAGEHVKCWGSNYVGQLGRETLPASSAPLEVSGLDGDMLAIATGGYHTCVLSGSAGVKCWGQNYQGELGDCNRPYSATPVSVTGLKTATFTSLTATAGPSNTPSPSPTETTTPTKTPPTLVPWPMPTALATLQAGQPVSLAWIHMLDAGSGWGIDAGGRILRTTDGGNTWRPANPPAGTYNEAGFFAADAQEAWAAALPVAPGSDGCKRATNCHLAAAVWHTTDGGAAWQPAKTWQPVQALPRPGTPGAADGSSNAVARGLYFVDPAAGWFLLEDWPADSDILTVLARTSDGGASLREVWRASGIGRYGGVAFVNKQVGYLGVDNTTFFDFLDGVPALKDYLDGRETPSLQKTSDGGKTWETVFLPELDPLPGELQALASTNERMLCGVEKLRLIPPQGILAQVICRVTGGTGPFSFDYLSPDGGENWHSWVASGNESFLNPATGWRIDQSGQFQRTTDGGINWATLATLPSGRHAGFDFINEQAGWAVLTDNGVSTLTRTADGGRTWVELRPVVINR